MDYRKTLNLPKTDFPMKAKLVEKEPRILEKWNKIQAYERLRELRSSRQQFILHDGPPYSNGHIHLGHALNKIAKDFVVRSKSMMGFDSPYLPGWDNHGMPIEMNILKEIQKKRGEIDTVTLRQKCRNYARQWVDIQRDEFVRLGIWGEWDRPYLTMDPEYEKIVLQTFGEMVEQGYIYRGKRPIHWCPKCETALAESEIEYKDKESISIYIRFPLKLDPNAVFPNEEKAYILIWTTTPWTIPANLAVVVHPHLDYAIVETGKVVYLLAERLVPVVMESIGITDYKIIKKVRGEELSGMVFTHPIMDRESPLFLGEHVNLEEGTGVVHTAPGHGMEDFLVGQREGLEILCPVDERGTFTHEGGKYEGKYVDEVNHEVLRDLGSIGDLLLHESITHSYPHCWRCKNALLFRTTTQWFFSIDHNSLRQKALDAIESVRWSPLPSKNRILGMIRNRPDWCLSRQREWGVGIPVLICNQCDHPLLSRDVVFRVAEKVGEEGSDCWFTLDADEFLPEGVSCENCGGEDFRKETDILDVWFESGSSHLAALERASHLHWPAEIYLEGSDQHRGWFNTSLIVALAARGAPPYRWVITNGWTLDSEGKAMHKLEGNVVSPLDIIEERGADILRLWVASNDFKSDVRFSTDTLDQVSETYRRIRNTCRFLLSNLSDYNDQENRVPYTEMLEIDQYALHQLERFKERVRETYEEMEFHLTYHVINAYCTTISSFYLDVLKDRLYTFARESRERRSAQSVLYDMIHALVRIIAPILTFTSEEIWTYLGDDENESVHLLTMDDIRDEHIRPDLEDKWQRIMILRGEAQKALEVSRANGEIGSSLEATVELSTTDPDLKEFIDENIDKLPSLFIVSQVILNGRDDKDSYHESTELPLHVGIRRADGKKCIRCWNYTTDVGSSEEHPEICKRCITALHQEVE
jgi:isoleucyl-tRNA synthetase